MEEFDYSKLQAATNDFSLSRLIGKGSHGCVYKGVLGDGRLVAVKTSSAGLRTLQDNSKLDNEIEILSSLHRSLFLVNLVGVSHDSSSKRKLLVMEFMRNGSLYDSLHSATTPPNWPKRALIALQVARAVQILHEAKPSVIHRDIKSANVLFDSNWDARLADFGLAVKQNDANSLSRCLSRPAGTMGYLDPCYTTPGKLSTKNDVFSFGILLLEIISCRRAIDIEREPASIVEWAIPLIDAGCAMEVCDSRVTMPSNMAMTIQAMLNIAARCVSSKEECRPSIVEIVKELENYVVKRFRFPLWMCRVKRIFLRRRHKRTMQTTAIVCTTDEADDLPRGKLLIRDVLAEVGHS